MTFRSIEGEFDNKRPLSEMYWASRGWTSSNMNGAYVGCPEMPDGRECVFSFICIQKHNAKQIQWDFRVADSRVTETPQLNGLACIFVCI